jgi:hypothetical protein
MAIGGEKLVLRRIVDKINVVIEMNGALDADLSIIQAR